MAKVEPKIKRETLNNKKKLHCGRELEQKKNSIVDENLTLLELAEMLRAVYNDETEYNGRDTSDNSNGIRKKNRSSVRVQVKKPPLEKICDNKECKFKHNCTWCSANDHGGHMCPETNQLG